MWISRAKSVLSIALLGAAATLGSIGSAQAALYTGRWDPAYGGIFPSLYWNAVGVFDLPSGCSALGSGPVDPGLPGPCAGFAVKSMTVDFYDVSAPTKILESFSLSTDVDVTGIDLTGGKLTGIDTDFFKRFTPTLPIAGGGDYAFSLILYGSNKGQLIYADPPTTSPECASFPVEGASCGVSAVAAIGVITPVPEPEIYALMLAGLGVMAFVARRRRGR